MSKTFSKKEGDMFSSEDAQQIFTSIITVALYLQTKGKKPTPKDVTKLMDTYEMVYKTIQKSYLSS
jgi:hypothetical protein